MDNKVLWDYKSPIEIIQAEVKRRMEDNILKAVVDYDIKIDKHELLRALQYDRGQYQKGYDDAMRSITHCANCEHAYNHGVFIECMRFNAPVKNGDFCSYGERRSEV